MFGTFEMIVAMTGGIYHFGVTSREARNCQAGVYQPCGNVFHEHLRPHVAPTLLPSNRTGRIDAWYRRAASTGERERGDIFYDHHTG